MRRLEPAAITGVMSREVANFRTFWKATTFSSVLEPIVYLLAFGLGLGATVVDRVDGLRTEGTTILMSTHYIEEAERLADEVALMAEGKIVARGRPAELIAEHAGRETAEVYGPPDLLEEARRRAEAHGLAVRPAGPAIAIVGAERARDGAVPSEAVRRAASLEDVFVLLTGEEAE